MGRRDVVWILIGAVALAASLAGHALQLALENARLFGGQPALYNHVLQAPIAQATFALLLLGGFFVARGVIESARGQFEDADWVLPALAAIREIDPRRLALVIVALQLASLVVGELAEQALCSYGAFGLAAIFGPGHWSAPFVHVLIGTLLALTLSSFARAVCDRAASIARFVRLLVERLAAAAPIRFAPLLRAFALSARVLLPPPLARHIASRPPPVFATVVA